MNRKYIVAVLAALMICASASADKPFRNHRYDAMGIMPVHQGDIVFVGNSITNMHEWWEAFGCQQNILNRGVSGCVSSETLENIGGIAAGKPAKVFLMIGTNDLATDGLDDPQKILSNVKEMVARFKAESPETQIYIQSVLPVGEGNRRSAESIIALNDLYKEFCEAEGLTYVDLWSKFVVPGTTVMNPAYSLDGLHLYPSGYKVWCDEIAQYVGTDCSYVEGELDNCDLPGSFGMRAAAFGWQPLDEDDIVIIGDEMIHGGEWHELLGSPRVKNRGTCWGFGGPMIQTIQDELPAIFKSGKSPEQIYLHIGAAEVANNAPLDSILVRYRRLVEAIKATAPGSELFLMTPQPVYYSHNKTADADSVNTGIKAIADELGVGFVDIHTPLCKDGRGDINYVNGNYVYGKGYLKIARILAESMGLPVPPVSYATRNTAFTGRGNEGETLVTYTVSPDKPVKLRKMAVTLDAAATDVTALSVRKDGELLGKVKVKAGKSAYRIPCRAVIDDLADVELCADIAEDAAEGGTVSADIVKVRMGGKWLPVQAPAPGSREILLRRVKVLGQGDYNTTGYRIPAIECLQDGTLLITTDRRKDNDLDLPEEERARRTAKCVHRYLPVIRRTPDVVEGVYDRETGRTDDALFVPETVTLDDLLVTFRRSRKPLAIVLDEYGGTAGLIAESDIQELIFGPMVFSRAEDEPQIRPVGPRAWEIDARANLDEINRELGIELEADDADRLSGWVAVQAERLPHVGQEIVADGCRATILKRRHRRVTLVRLEVLEYPKAENDAAILAETDEAVEKTEEDA